MLKKLLSSIFDLGPKFPFIGQKVFFAFFQFLALMTSQILGQIYLSPIFSDFSSQNNPRVDYTKFFRIVFRFRHVLGQNIEQGRFS